MTYNRIKNKVNIINSKNGKRETLIVQRSNRYIVASILGSDGVVLASASSKNIQEKVSPVEKAKLVGGLIAKAAKEKKVINVVFNRNKYSYHGQVKALADGAREAGLKF